MPFYRRRFVAGGTYFLTVVTDDRRHFLDQDHSRDCLRQAIEKTRTKLPFDLIAMVLLPEHYHILLSLPESDSDFSTRIRQIKERYTRSFRRHPSARHLTQPYWQTRFWEHVVRDEDDHERCFDYIHYNPVKHGLVKQVCDYPWSTFHRYVKEGIYPLHWGQGEVVKDISGAEWD